MSRPRSHKHAIFTSVIWLVWVVGCGTSARVHLRQPGFQGLQREMDLASRWAFFEDRPPYSWYQFSFPLPGAVSGDKQYHLFLLAAEGADDFSAGKANPEQRRFRGFFIQSKGPGAGLTEITGGTLSVRGGKSARSLRLHAQFDDGSEINGTLRATRNRYEMEKFDKRYAGDIRDVLGGPRTDTKDKKYVAPAPR